MGLMGLDVDGGELLMHSGGQLRRTDYTDAHGGDLVGFY